MLKNFFSLVAIVLVSSELFAQTMTIQGVDLVGSGCGPATAQAVITPDGQTLSVLFDHYSAEIGTGSENPQMRVMKKDCHVMIHAIVPFGVQYAIQQIDYNGFAALPASAYGFHRFTQFMQGSPIPSLREAQLKGPLADNFSVSVKGKPGRQIYSTCNNANQTIDLFSELMVSYFPNTVDRSMAQISVDSTDVATSSRFRLVWRKCR